MSDLISRPFTLTTVEDPSPLSYATLAAHGWAPAFQVQNGGNSPRDFDLGPARNAGCSPGVWGVTYNAADFRRDGETLGKQAVKLGAEHVQMDVEEAAKFTRASRGMKPIVDGIRAGGWAGPVHLNTMGAPDGDGDDYQVDVQSFLETGGGVISQDYYNESMTFSPFRGVAYWCGKCGVPKDRYSSMIGLHISAPDKRRPNLRLSGAEWLPLLVSAGIRRNVSIFMTEFATGADLTALDALTLAVSPTIEATWAATKSSSANRSPTVGAMFASALVGFGTSPPFEVGSPGAAIGGEPVHRLPGLPEPSLLRRGVPRSRGGSAPRVARLATRFPFGTGCRDT